MGRRECIAQAEHYYSVLKKEFNTEPTFEDLIKYRINLTSKKSVEEHFDFYKFGWDLIGKDISNAQEVYELYLFSATYGYMPTTQSLLDENDEILKHSQDPNVNVLNPSYMKDIYERSTVVNMSDDDDVVKLKCEDCKKIIWVDKFDENVLCKECKKTQIEESNKRSNYKGIKIIAIVGSGLLIYFFNGYSLAIIAAIGIILGFLYEEFIKNK